MKGCTPAYDTSPSNLSACSGFARNMTRSGSVSNLSRGPRIAKSPLCTGCGCLFAEAMAVFSDL